MKDNRLTFTSGYQQTISLSVTINTALTWCWVGGYTLEINQNSITQVATAGDISIDFVLKTILDYTSTTTNTLKSVIPIYVTSHSLDLFMVNHLI